MTATVTAPAPSGLPPVAVTVPARSVRGDLRSVRIVWKRELIRFFGDRLRIATSLVQPFLFLFVLGTGLSRISSAGTHGLSYRTFIYPGVLCMAVMFTAMFSAASLVWDREFGFLREMMVAPVRRGALVVGKCLGGATVAGFQGAILIAMAGLAGIPYAPVLVLEIFALQLLVAFTITAFGVMAAARVTQMQSFMALMQMLMMPLFFLAGSLYPVSGLPRWLEILNRLDPLTYAVDLMRRLVFVHLDVAPAARHALARGVTWWGWRVPGGVEAAVIAVLGAVMLAIAVVEFSRIE